MPFVIYGNRCIMDDNTQWNSRWISKDEYNASFMHRVEELYYK